MCIRDRDATVTFGTLTDTMADMWQSVNHALKSNSQQNALYDLSLIHI